jgi:hypothetical protein
MPRSRFASSLATVRMRSIEKKSGSIAPSTKPGALSNQQATEAWPKKFTR